MKKIHCITCLSMLFMCFHITKSYAQVSVSPVAGPVISYPWTEGELIEPAVLATAIKSGNIKGLVLNIGAVEDIPGATHIGAASDHVNMEKLQKTLAGVPKNTAIIIYCGCCPFTKCPNIRPAYNELKKLGFSDIKVLDLPKNLKINWIAKGYPLAKAD